MEPLEIESEEHGLLREGPITIRVLPAKQARQRKLSLGEMVSLSMYWFGWSFLWLPLLVVMIPSQVSRMAEEGSKGSALSHTLLLGSVASVFGAPIFGSLSDSSRNAMGRRRPFMIVGTLLASFALVWMAAATDLYWYSLGFLLLSAANNMILAPYSALVPDLVPHSQRGLASGWLGLMSMLGNLCGGMLTYFLDKIGWSWTYIVLLLVHGASMAITVRVMKEVPIRTVVSPFKLKDRLVSFMRPLRAHDFRLVFFTRFLMQMGILSVQEYLQFYVQDAIAQPYTLFGLEVAANASEAVSVLFVPMLLGATASSLTAGVISDRLGGQRKRIVYLSGAIMALTCVLFSFTRSYAFDMLLGMLFGFGFGAFSVMDWAMAADVLPNVDEFAKDMGIWSLALVLPQIIAAPVSGFLLDYFQKVGPEINLGYSVVFLVAVVYYALGTFFVKFIDSVN